MTPYLIRRVCVSRHVLNINNVVGFLEQKSVVGPLVALIVEQVQGLTVKGVHAALFHLEAKKARW